MLASLDALSEEVEGTATYIRLYARFQNVLPSAEELYLAVLHAIEAIMTWFEKLTKRKAQSTHMPKRLND